MRVVLWQNMVSLHQSAFVRALAGMEGVEQVTLVAQEEMPQYRREDGWSMPDMGRAKVIVRPDDEVVDELVRVPAWHVFSGINAYPMVWRGFKGVIRHRSVNGGQMAVMMEPYQWQGVKGLLRRGKYTWLLWRYGRYIRHLFATGELGVRAFRKAGFPAARLHQWGYFTEIDNNGEASGVTPDATGEAVNTADNGAHLPRMVFVGSIDSRKNVLQLARAAKGLTSLFEEFVIVGRGPLEGQLREVIAGVKKIHFIGAVSNHAVPALLRQADLLVLPSRFDGWGAVVNEALGVGTRVLCSDRCGASSLLDGDLRGGTFPFGREGAIDSALRHWLSKGSLTATQRAQIRRWASERISGEAAAKHFVASLRQPSDSQIFTPPPFG